MILFVQFTNPAGYPPLEHASRILADQGWRVLFVGLEVKKGDARVFPPHPGIAVKMMPAVGSGILMLLGYITYLLWVLGLAVWHRPKWLYASDPLACPAALLVSAVTGCRVLYHEHDTPTYREPMSRALRAVRAARHKVANSAEICVVPQEQRLRDFVAETERVGITLRVHNYPRKEEAAPAARTAHGPITFYYHGNLSTQTLPLEVLDAFTLLADARAQLTIVGYETASSNGFMSDFLDHASRLGLRERVCFVGTLPRHAMLNVAGRADVGLALMQFDPANPTMAHLAGASNKPFDYLAKALPFLVTDHPDWQRMFVEPGFARACNPSDPTSIADAMRWFTSDIDRARKMGEAGRQTILERWNYETEFAPVVAILAEEQRS